MLKFISVGAFLVATLVVPHIAAASTSMSKKQVTESSTKKHAPPKPAIVELEAETNSDMWAMAQSDGPSGFTAETSYKGKPCHLQLTYSMGHEGKTTKFRFANASKLFCMNTGIFEVTGYGEDPTTGKSIPFTCRQYFKDGRCEYASLKQGYKFIAKISDPESPPKPKTEVAEAKSSKADSAKLQTQKSKRKAGKKNKQSLAKASQQSSSQTEPVKQKKSE